MFRSRAPNLTFLLVVFFIASSDGDDSSILLGLREHDPLMTLKSWNSSISVCQWEGVACSTRGRVVGLRLHSLSSLSTSLLTSTIQGLSQLRELHVSGSNFTSSIEDMSLQACPLNVLDLSANRLPGGLPSQLLADCPRIKLLNLSNNMLTGLVPPSFFSTCNLLQHLDLSKNQLTGKVPEQIVKNCIVLESISLAYNNFSGAFPSFNASNNIRSLKLASNSFTTLAIDSDKGCRNLSQLDISSNLLSSQVFFTTLKAPICASLKVLNISNNYFSGDFVSALVGEDLDFTTFLPSLELLDASFNKFAGQVPTIYANLQYVDFSSNGFGTTGANICSSPSRLHTLMLPNNNLVGQVLHSVADCARLKLLDLSFNSLTGEIPDNLCANLPRLGYLLAWVNRLQGRIPSSLGNCSSLKLLVLGHNNLEGAIPSELGQLEKLWWLSLINNRLTGRIPSLSKTRIKLVQLSNNFLDGEIPSELDDCEHLVDVELSGNSLTGRIPGRIGRKHAGVEFLNVENDDLVANLRFVLVAFNVNKAAGAAWTSIIPVQGIHFAGLEKLLSNRSGKDIKLSYFPSIEWNLTSPVILELSHNRFTGEIPAEIGQMLSMQSFFVEHNSLSGTIPESLGNLKNLLYMDLSQNALQGSIPDSFSQLNFGQFNVSANNLSGLIPQSGKLTTFPASSYGGNPGLCGFPLSVGCKANNVTSVLHDQHSNDDDDHGNQVLNGSLISGAISFVVFSNMAFFWQDRRTHYLENLLDYYVL